MYRCQLCSCVVQPGTAAHRLVTQTRIKHYPHRSEANRVVYMNERGKRKEKYVDDPGGRGREIVQELIVCPDCAKTSRPR